MTTNLEYCFKLIFVMKKKRGQAIFLTYMFGYTYFTAEKNMKKNFDRIVLVCYLFMKLIKKGKLQYLLCY